MILADALKHPPPGFFGGDAVQTDGTPVGGGPERRSYVTGSADKQGNLIWTDIYRFGRVAAVVPVLEKTDTQQIELRKPVASRIEANVK